MKGILIPAEVQNPSDQPEYPIIKRKYFIQLLVVEDGNGNDDDDDDKCVTSQCDHVEKEATTSWRQMISQSKNPSTCSLCTPCYEWSEEIALDWSVDIVRHDLLAFRNFLQHGLHFFVVEEKILLNPAEPEVVEAPLEEKTSKTTKPTSKGKKESGKKQDKPAPPPPPPPTNDKNKKSKKEEQKEVLDTQLIESPPEYTTLACFHAPLEHLLDGDHDLCETYLIEWPPSPSSDPSAQTAAMEEADKGKKKKEKEKESAEKSKAGDSKGKKEDASKTKLAAAKKSKSPSKEKVIEEMEDKKPNPLHLQLSVRLHKYLSTEDVTRKFNCYQSS